MYSLKYFYTGEKFMFCKTCGNELDNQALICPKCGVPTANYNKTATTQSSVINVTSTLLVFLSIILICSALMFLLWSIFYSEIDTSLLDAYLVYSGIDVRITGYVYLKTDFAHGNAGFVLALLGLISSFTNLFLHKFTSSKKKWFRIVVVFIISFSTFITSIPFI
jgi:hypothetical protein